MLVPPERKISTSRYDPNNGCERDCEIGGSYKLSTFVFSVAVGIAPTLHDLQDLMRRMKRLPIRGLSSLKRNALFR